MKKYSVALVGDGKTGAAKIQRLRQKSDIYFARQMFKCPPARQCQRKKAEAQKPGDRIMNIARKDQKEALQYQHVYQIQRIGKRTDPQEKVFQRRQPLLPHLIDANAQSRIAQHSRNVIENFACRSKF